MADVTLRPIRRLLVANRGEIACRVMRTARGMGIETVAVYADGDAREPHVYAADRALALGGRTPAETYLDVRRLIDAARRTGADAVHPGYGFLSENAAFAQAVIDAGRNWVGPPPDAIRRLGDKLEAKRLVAAVGVPTLEAVALVDDGDDGGAEAAAARIGYPLLVKAAAGGGGRGMRVVGTPDELAPAVAAARREARAAFGDGRLFVERWLERARHVEVQILGDRHGHLVHLFERECSIQRRHQKIVEEAPSTAVDAALRERLGRAALDVARRVGYHGAGTVEFLLGDGAFWFLEVNTRLQVEHPVTEAVTGIDLVREQIRVAEGEPLGYTQADLRIAGHAIEARLCAEDAARGFLPATGRVEAWAPATGDGVRVDAGIDAGSEVGIEFDALLAKVVAWAPTRREAASRLARALERTRLQGITHNRDLLVSIVRAPEFLAGDTHTDFIERVAPAPLRAPDRAAIEVAAIGAALHARAHRRASARLQQALPGGFRNSAMPPERVAYRSVGTEVALAYRVQRDGSLDVEVDERTCHVVVLDASDRDIDLEIDGLRARLAVDCAGDRRLVHGPDGDVELVEQPRFPPPAAAAARGGLRAPMPGRVLSVLVAPGDAVMRGQPLLVIEAMKIEQTLAAPADGTVRALAVAAGQQVGNGALLVEIDEGSTSPPA